MELLTSAIYAGTIKKEPVVDFLKALVRHLDQPLLIVWDRLPGHRSQQMQDYIASLQGWICTAYLPPYAPETKPGPVYLGLLEATRVAERLSEGLLAIERICTTNATSHASSSASDHRLLEAIFFVAGNDFILCGTQWQQRPHRGQLYIGCARPSLVSSAAKPTVQCLQSAPILQIGRFQRHIERYGMTGKGET